MTRKPIVLLSAMLVALAVRPVEAQRFIFTGAPDSAVVSFLGRLQRAVTSGNRTTVANMVLYPLRVNRDATHHKLVATAAELVRQYDAVFTPAIRQAITTETPARLTGGRDGAGIKAGEVWIGGRCDRGHPPKCALGVTSVNLHNQK